MDTLSTVRPNGRSELDHDDRVVYAESEQQSVHMQIVYKDWEDGYALNIVSGHEEQELSISPKQAQRLMHAVMDTDTWDYDECEKCPCG